MPIISTREERQLAKAMSTPIIADNSPRPPARGGGGEEEWVGSQRTADAAAEVGSKVQSVWSGGDASPSTTSDGEIATRARSDSVGGLFSAATRPVSDDGGELEGAAVVEGGTANSNLTDENDGRRADTYQSSGIRRCNN